MKIISFLKDKIITISLLIFAIITTEIFLTIYDIPLFIKIYLAVSIVLMYCIGLLIEYMSKHIFYKKIKNMLNELEEKYLITELIGNTTHVEEENLKYILEETNKSMLENVNKYKYMTEDYKEYIELWIHEIKIPIATSKMIIENNKNEVTKSISEEIDKVENYIEQALYYARSNVTEKDYLVKKNQLSEIVNESIKKNKNLLIQEKITIDLHDLNADVYTDSKWIIFTLSQIIQNSIKYMKSEENRKITIYARQNAENVVLYIEDNGIGIKQEEVARVFEKGFTGTNGRIKNKKSTGIGLYLCKKLCDKRGIGIVLRSEEERGTDVKLIFPKGRYADLR